MTTTVRANIRESDFDQLVSGKTLVLQGIDNLRVELLLDDIGFSRMIELIIEAHKKQLREKPLRERKDS